MIKFQFKVQSRDNFAYLRFSRMSKKLPSKHGVLLLNKILFNDLNHIKEIRIQRMIINTLR